MEVDRPEREVYTYRDTKLAPPPSLSRFRWRLNCLTHIQDYLSLRVDLNASIPCLRSVFLV
jgi:hypothetical protein